MFIFVINQIRKSRRENYLYSETLRIQHTNPKLALKYLKEALNYDENFVDGLILAGAISIDPLNLLQEAKEYITRAEKILIGKGKKRSEPYAKILYYLGWIENNKGDYDRALEYFFKAKEYLDFELHKPSSYTTVISNIGSVYQKKGSMTRH